eukprot:3168579-Amphidinium_carterae.1
MERLRLKESTKLRVITVMSWAFLMWRPSVPAIILPQEKRKMEDAATTWHEPHAPYIHVAKSQWYCVNARVHVPRVA